MAPRGHTRRNFRYADRVLQYLPTYYWPMQDTLKGPDAFRPAASDRFLKTAGTFDYVESAHSADIAAGINSFECGTNARGASGSVNANQNTTGYSYMIWAKQNATQSNSAYASNWTTNAGSMIHLTTAPGILVYHNGSNSSVSVSQDTSWHCWIVTWDGTTQITYRDGVSVLNVARSGALASVSRLSAGYYNYSTSTALNGSVCHFAWWENRALTPAEVTVLTAVT